MADVDERPEQDAHSGSMAPGQADDIGHRVSETPPTSAE